MTIASGGSDLLTKGAPPGTTGLNFYQFFWQAPLFPVAIAATLGLWIDRQVEIPLPFSLTLLGSALVAWIIIRNTRQPFLPLVFLGCAVAAFAATYHHCCREIYPKTDLGNFASAEPKPVHLRGWLDEEPIILWGSPKDPLRSIPDQDSTRGVLRVGQWKQNDDWVPVSGRAELIVSGQLPGLHSGDEIEVVGRLQKPPEPANPGEADRVALLKDQRIRAEVVVGKTPDGVIPLGETLARSPAAYLAMVRGWGQRVLQKTVGDANSGVAMALLLGEGSTMTTENWERYQRAGVIHILAISGLHLAVLGGFVWSVLRLFRVRQRRGVVVVATLLLTYALLTGCRPPAMRSAVMVWTYGLGVLLRRPVLPANSFALAWLAVMIRNPTDLAGPGCQLSFLALAVLYWGIHLWFEPNLDPLEKLVERSRPVWQQSLRRWLRRILGVYGITLVVWLAQVPLVASHYHLVSPIGVIIGPPAVLLACTGLLSGFLLLLSAAAFWPLVPLFGHLTRISLTACEWLVTKSQVLPGGFWYVSDIPGWWLTIFYLGLFLVLIVEPLRRRPRWLLAAVLAWVCVGFANAETYHDQKELRCTFVAVGHGGCTVLEAPDGRVLVYDAGSLSGPDVARRQIAPFLWHRGIRRIDEVLLSHADLDHFNALPALLDRFAIGQVSCTPTFSHKGTPGAIRTLALLEERKIPVRILQAGDRLSAGAVVLEVLHPPEGEFEGNENSRSLVLRVNHAGHSILLTGDLDGPGLERVLALPLEPLDILMAPHHGSRAGTKQVRLDRAELVGRTRPALLVSCEGRPLWPVQGNDPYGSGEAQYLGTWPHGAITVHSRVGSLVVETFRSQQCFSLASRKK